MAPSVVLLIPDGTLLLTSFGAGSSVDSFSGLTCWLLLTFSLFAVSTSVFSFSGGCETSRSLRLITEFCGVPCLVLTGSLSLGSPPVVLLVPDGTLIVTRFGYGSSVDSLLELSFSLFCPSLSISLLLSRPQQRAFAT